VVSHSERRNQYIPVRTLMQQFRTSSQLVASTVVIGRLVSFFEGKHLCGGSGLLVNTLRGLADKRRQLPVSLRLDITVLVYWA